MQKIIVFVLLGLAIIYLVVKFIVKNKSHHCDKCELNDTEKSLKN